MNYLLVFLCLIHAPIAWAQKMGCKQAQTSKPKSCNLKVEKQELILKKVADACKKATVIGYTDEFIREQKQLDGSSFFMSPEDLKTSINYKKTTIEKMVANIDTQKKQISTLNEEENNKKGIVFDEIKAKLKQLSAEYKNKVAEADKDYAKRQQLFTEYYKDRDELEKSLMAVGYIDKVWVQENIQYSESSLKLYQADLENSEKTLAKLEASGETVEPVSEADRVSIKKLVAVNAKSMRSKSGYVECGLTDIELYAIRLYTGSGYRKLNEALRKQDKKEQEKYLQMTSAINSGLAKLESYVQLVRRGTTLNAEALKPYCQGCTVTMKAFTSTSSESGFAGEQEFIIKGKSGAYIDPISSAQGEKEVLFPTNVKFKILKIEGKQYTMEEVTE